MLFPDLSKIKFNKLPKKIIPYLGASLLITAIDKTNLPQAIDLIAYDYVISKKELKDGINDPIVLVTIEESDIKEYGWPIDDDLFCRGIDTLDKNGAKAIGLDIYRDKGVGKYQKCLNERFTNNSKLVSIFNVANNISAIPGTPPERQSFNDLTLDADGVLRRDLVHVSGQNDSTVSFPLRLYEIAFNDTLMRNYLENDLLEDAWIGKNSGIYRREIDAGLGMQRMLRFRKPGSFARFSLNDLLTGEILQSSIEGKIVLIGSSAPSLKDLFEVPFSRFESGDVMMRIPGVEIHANRLATFIEQKNGTYNPGLIVGNTVKIIFILFTIFISIIFGESYKKLHKSLIVNLFSLTTISILLVYLLFNNILIGVSIPLLGILTFSSSAMLRRGLVGQKHTQQIRKLLGQATSPAIAEQLWQQRDQLLKNGKFEGRKIWVTVLFTDMVNFTKVSENLDPSELMDWLNRGMAVCVPAITKRGGMVNKFTGDGMLAAFGVPISSSFNDDALAAISAANEINEELSSLNKSLRKEGLPEMKIRMGIHSGEILAGSMGSAERVEYALIGDTVNCASRLESLDKNKHKGYLRVLLSSNTKELLTSDTINEERFIKWGPMKVKGRLEEINVFELLFTKRK